jgi:hypothetical protein
MLTNTRGLSDLAKHLHISYCPRDHNLDCVAISKTCRRDFSQSLLNRLSGGIDLSGYLDLPEVDHGDSNWSKNGQHGSIRPFLGRDCHIKLHIRNRADNFKWSLVTMYGTVQDEFKANFLRELVNLAKDNPYLILIGGDFNLLRFRHEKSIGRFNNH